MRLVHLEVPLESEQSWGGKWDVIPTDGYPCALPQEIMVRQGARSGKDQFKGQSHHVS